MAAAPQPGHRRWRARGAPCSGEAVTFEIGPGTFDALLWVNQDGFAGLAAGYYELGDGLWIDGPANLDLDLHLVRLRGSLLLNGRLPERPATCADKDAVVLLHRAGVSVSAVRNSVATTISCKQSGLPWTALVAPGEYEILVRPFKAGQSSLPDTQLVGVRRIEVR